MAITDYITQTRDGGNPTATTVSTARSAGGASLSCDDLTNWPNDTVHFITYKKTASGAIDYDTLQDFKGIVSGNTIGTVTLKHSPTGSDLGNAIGDFVEMAPTATWAQDLYDGLAVEHDVDGKHKSTIISSRTAITTTATGDTALVGDASDSNALKKVTLQNLLPDSSVTPAKRSGGFAIGTISSSTLSTTGNKAITGVGFTPKLVRFALISSSTASSSAGYGGMTSSDQWYSVHASDGANGNRSGGIDACFGGIGTTGGAILKASYVSMDSDGFTVNVSIASSVWTVAYEAYA